MTTENRILGWCLLSSYEGDATGLVCRIFGSYATSDEPTCGTIVADYGDFYEVEIDGQHHFIDAGKMVGVSVWG